ncbi:MAG: dihydrolipoamide acetyltransferase family protein [Candidatus Norongarragalinales archaeon]
MVYLFKFPDVGEGIHEGTVVKVLVSEGQAVKTDEPLFEVETDKAVVELPSPQTGAVLKIYVKQGEMIKVGQTIIAIGEKGEKAPENPDAGQASIAAVPKPSAAPAPPTQPQGELKTIATPAVRALAQKLGVDLNSVKGTGVGGRIMPSDVENAAKNPAQAQPAKTQQPKVEFAGPVERTPLSGLRKAIAEKMTAWLSVPQAGVSEDFDFTKLYEMREKLKREKPELKTSYLSFIVKAIALTLAKHPSLNATFLNETQEIAFKKYYNIGIATDTEHGLVVPVIKNADKKKIPEIAAEIETLAKAARERKIRLEDLKDGTFTITNVGSLGGVAVAPVINYPESAIIGLSKMRDTPVVFEGRIVARKIMRFDLGFDHRVLDGGDAMRFIEEVKAYIENPEKLEQYL